MQLGWFVCIYLAPLGASQPPVFIYLLERGLPQICLCLGALAGQGIKVTW